jgi:hypothetical protein
MERWLDAAADAVDPLLALLAIAAPGLDRRAGEGWAAAVRFWLRTACGLAGIYAVQALDGRFGLWPRWGLDYSTHTAFAVCLATSLALRRPRWLAGLVPLLAAYAGLMLQLGYHGLPDILSAAAVAAGLATLCHGAAVRRVAPPDTSG